MTVTVTSGTLTAAGTTPLQMMGRETIKVAREAMAAIRVIRRAFIPTHEEKRREGLLPATGRGR
jgi:hypothetical protein